MSEKIITTGNESPEPLPENVKILTRETFSEFLYPNQFLINDPRFESKDNGGAFMHFEPSDALSDLSDMLSGSENSERKFFVVSRENGVIAGIAALEISGNRENSYWVKSVDVDPEYQGKGHGRKLIEGIFNFAKKKSVTLIGSSRTDMGQERMGHIFEELSQKTGVSYISAEDDRLV